MMIKDALNENNPDTIRQWVQWHREIFLGEIDFGVTDALLVTNKRIINTKTSFLRHAGFISGIAGAFVAGVPGGMVGYVLGTVLSNASDKQNKILDLIQKNAIYEIQRERIIKIQFFRTFFSNPHMIITSDIEEEYKMKLDLPQFEQALKLIKKCYPEVLIEPDSGYSYK